MSHILSREEILATKQSTYLDPDDAIALAQHKRTLQWVRECLQELASVSPAPMYTPDTIMQLLGIEEDQRAKLPLEQSLAEQAARTLTQQVLRLQATRDEVASTARELSQGIRALFVNGDAYRKLLELTQSAPDLQPREYVVEVDNRIAPDPPPPAQFVADPTPDEPSLGDVAEASSSCALGQARSKQYIAEIEDSNRRLESKLRREVFRATELEAINERQRIRIKQLEEMLRVERAITKMQVT